VLLSIEVRGVEKVRDLQDRIGIDQQRAKDALLGVNRLGCELVDAHADAVQEMARIKPLLRGGLWWLRPRYPAHPG